MNKEKLTLQEQREKEIEDSIKEKERDMERELKYLQFKAKKSSQSSESSMNQKSFWLYDMEFTYPLDQDDYYKIQQERQEEQGDREFWNRRLKIEI